MAQQYNRDQGLIAFLQSIRSGETLYWNAASVFRTDNVFWSDWPRGFSPAAQELVREARAYIIDEMTEDSPRAEVRARLADLLSSYRRANDEADQSG